MKPSTEKNTYPQQRWSLKDLFSGLDDPALEKAFKTLEKDVKALESQRPIFTAEIAESAEKKMRNGRAYNRSFVGVLLISISFLLQVFH